MANESAPAPKAPAPANTASPPGAPHHDSAKCAQILDGARRVFLARGFDAASMGEIARAAGVSKGTLYVYFDSKEALFRALIEERKRSAAERLTAFDPSNHDVEAVLSDFARRFIEELTQPLHVSLVRMVIGAAEKFPDLGRAFFEAGPRYGSERLAAYLAAQAEHGVLTIEDPTLAAWHFLGLCHQPTMAATIMGAAPAPDAAQTERYARAAVAAFLNGYRTG